MKKFNLISVIVGTVFSACATFIAEYILYTIYVLPTGNGHSESFYNKLPPLYIFTSMLAAALICYLAGTIPLLIAEGCLKHSFYIGFFSALSAAFYILTTSYPAWYKIIYVAAFIPSSCLGCSLTKRIFTLHFP